MGCVNSKSQDETQGSEPERQGLMSGSEEDPDDGEVSEYSVSPLTESTESIPVLSRGEALINDSIVTAGRGLGSEAEVEKEIANSPDRDHTGQNAPTNSALLVPEEVVCSGRGKELLRELIEARTWKDRYRRTSQDFLVKMDRLFMECQLHLTAVSSQGDLDSRREADALVQIMVSLRDHWGGQLLPTHVCNAFVRERVPLTLGMEQRQFRVDCAQFFDPVPFYPNSENPGELMKLFRFSVYDVDKGEVVLRYYLERSNVIQLYHVLCFTCENYRGQVHPYGTEVPSYWEVRNHMLQDVHSRLLSALSKGAHPAPMAHASTTFPLDTGSGPVVIQVSAQAQSAPS